MLGDRGAFRGEPARGVVAAGVPPCRWEQACRAEQAARGRGQLGPTAFPPGLQGDAGSDSRFRWRALSLHSWHRLLSWAPTSRPEMPAFRRDTVFLVCAASSRIQREHASCQLRPV